MNRLLVSECLWPHTIRVLEEERPAGKLGRNIYAVFADSTENGDFRGIVTTHDIALHPSWIFADLTSYRPAHTLLPDAKVQEALKIMEEYEIHELPVVDDTGALLGIVSGQSIMEALFKRERTLLEESRHLYSMIDEEHRQVVAWSERLSDLHQASRTLLGVLAQTSLDQGSLQAGIESLARLLQVKHGAIVLIDEDDAVRQFIYTSDAEHVSSFSGHISEAQELLGIDIDQDVPLCLDGMSKGSQRTESLTGTFPLTKSFLAVPISCADRVHGRIYLSDKESCEPFNKDDEVLAKSFAHSLALVLDNAHETEAVEKARQRLDYLVNFDALTGLPNRMLFTDRIQQVLAHAQRTETMVAVMFIDLDNFKNVNDTIGHNMGDILLKEVAQKISDCLRVSDMVARLGGDEFIVMLADISDVQDIAKISLKILRSLAQGILIKEHELYISASIGISIYPNDAPDMEKLLADADTAMYHAKKLGKNNYQFFSAEMNVASQNALKLERHLRHAIERNELLLDYQPQVDAITQKIVGMEALLRWNSAEFGLVSPADFIPLAEETGLIIPIGAWVLRTACKQAKQWQQAGTPMRVAVNLSARQFQHHQSQHDLLHTVLNALRDADLEPGLLELEITESVMMQHIERTLDILKQLKAVGVHFSLDDFGTGYSSLSYLKRFPVDTLKIDKSFIKDIPADEANVAIVAAITAMAHQLNFVVIAEGVETSEQLEFLRTVRCHAIQGYYFSRPLSATKASELLKVGMISI